MPKQSKNIFSVNGDTIFIKYDDCNSVALATYCKDYYEELTTHTWSIKNGYPFNQTLGGGLHRYMMSKWYGDDVLSDMTARGFVVDHMNNNHLDCRISNLEFLKHNRNVAKGQYFDKESALLQPKLAVSMHKDFKTKCYQITIGCNATLCAEDGRYVNAIFLLYNCPYSQVILDAEKLLTMYDEEQKISLDHLSFCDKRISFAPNLNLSDEEKKQPFIIRNGIPYLILGNGKAPLKSVHYIENWEPPYEDK